MSNTCGVLLVGHGSREATATAEFMLTACKSADLLAPVPVEPCFLEYAEPTIGHGLERLVARGAARVVAVPVLLFAAAHAQRDIPLALAEAGQKFPHIQVAQAEHLGCHRRIVALSQAKYDARLAALPDVPAAETTLVLVGRGSYESSALAEFAQFLALRQDTTAARCTYGFLAMAQPTVEDVLAELAQQAVPPRRIVVQPHLLFGGRLVERVVGLVQVFAQRYPGVEWQTVDELGPSDELVQAIVERAGPWLAEPL